VDASPIPVGGSPGEGGIDGGSVWAGAMVGPITPAHVGTPVVPKASGGYQGPPRVCGGNPGPAAGLPESLAGGGVVVAGL